MEKIKVNLSNEEIRIMNKYQFKKLIRRKCKESAYEYLMNKRGKKGQHISYTSIRMSEYLLPNENLSIEDQRKVFEIRNNMMNIPSNFISEKDNTNICVCGKTENMTHIYNCEKLNKNKPRERYEQIFENNLNKMKYILTRFGENMKQREQLIENLKSSQEILKCDPLQFCSYGNY